MDHPTTRQPPPKRRPLRTATPQALAKALLRPIQPPQPRKREGK